MTDKCTRAEGQEWWWPKLVGKETIERLRRGYPEEERLNDDELLMRFGYEGHKYEASALWDHVGDAKADYDRLADSHASLTEKVERYADVLDDIVRWSKAYPLEVFPEPDLKKAHEILKANGMTLDAISASSMRHVVTEVGKMAANALLES